MVAYSIAALIGQLAHRRLTTDDGVTAAEKSQISSFSPDRQRVVATGPTADGLSSFAVGCAGESLRVRNPIDTINH